MSTTTYDSLQKTDQERETRRISGWIKWVVAAIAVVLLAATVTIVSVNVTDSSGSAPAVDAVEPLPATHGELLIAAEWAKYLETVRPELFPPVGHRATYQDLMLAAAYAPR
jgi:hypothetical protein